MRSPSMPPANDSARLRPRSSYTEQPPPWDAIVSVRNNRSLNATSCGPSQASEITIKAPIAKLLSRMFPPSVATRQEAAAPTSVAPPRIPGQKKMTRRLLRGGQRRGHRGREYQLATVFAPQEQEVHQRVEGDAPDRQ